jgi:hypothetical protein
MKKVIALLLVTLAVCIGGTATALSAPVNLVVNGKTINSDVPPQIIDGRTMVPIRVVAEGLGASVAWSEEENTAYISWSDKVNVLFSLGAMMEADPTLADDISRLIVSRSAARLSPAPVAPISPNTITSKIDGEFTGWEGETIFQLTNGQVWQQDFYAYKYHYAFMPDVLIYQDGSRYKMKVEGVDDAIYVKRLR